MTTGGPTPPGPATSPDGVAGPDAGATVGALRLSVVAGVVSAVLALVWGLLAGSSVIVFDGVSALIGLVLSAMSLVAARAAAAARRHRSTPTGASR